MRHIVLSLAVLIALGLAYPAVAQDFDGAEPAPDSSMDEFKKVGPGLFMTPEVPATPQDQQPVNLGIGVPMPGVKFDIPGHNASGTQPEETRPLTMDEVMQEYRLGNYKKLLPSLELLVRNGHHSAEELLAMMYKAGQGVQKNPKKAFELMQKAADANRALAQHHLGVMYFTGEGLDAPDMVKSLMWIYIAIAHYQDGPEKVRALQDRDSILNRLSRREKERANELALSWLEKKGEEHLFQSTPQ